MQTQDTKSLDRLAAFALIWACQACVHQEFYQDWILRGDVLGWILTAVAVAVLIRPRSVAWLSTMLVTSALYNFGKWPFVVNHILVETLINLTIFGALAWTFVGSRGSGDGPASQRWRDLAYDRFAPVVRTMLIVLYYFAFVAKLNTGFLDPEVSCTSVMYVDLLRRFPFLPDTEWARVGSIWSTMVIEALIPVFLTFRKTRPVAILIGLPFHLMLGLIGHRTFSGLAYALYFLFLDEAATGVLNDWRAALMGRLTADRQRIVRWAAPAAVVSGVGLLALIAALGFSRAGLGPLKFFRIPWAIWISWSLVMMALYGQAILRMVSIPRPEPPRHQVLSAKPGLLWIAVALVFLNGSSQYLGLKTETSFTMYSNLRTEDGRSNHLIVPQGIKIAGYQEDLVDIVETDHPDLRLAIENDVFLTYFEFRRTVSDADQDFRVVYTHNGETREFRREGGIPSDPELARKHPMWQAKLLYFRPVGKELGERQCQH